MFYFYFYILPTIVQRELYCMLCNIFVNCFLISKLDICLARSLSNKEIWQMSMIICYLFPWNPIFWSALVPVCDIFVTFFILVYCLKLCVVKPALRCNVRSDLLAELLESFIRCCPAIEELQILFFYESFWQHMLMNLYLHYRRTPSMQVYKQYTMLTQWQDSVKSALMVEEQPL